MVVNFVNFYKYNAISCKIVKFNYFKYIKNNRYDDDIYIDKPNPCYV